MNVVDAIAAVEAGEKSRRWFEETYLEDGVLYVTRDQYRAILKASESQPLPLALFDSMPRADGIEVVIRPAAASGTIEHKEKQQ